MRLFLKTSLKRFFGFATTIVLHYRNSSWGAVFPGPNDSESVRIANLNATAVAKHYDFYRDSVFSAKGSFGWRAQETAAFRRKPKIFAESAGSRSSVSDTLGLSP